MTDDLETPEPKNAEVDPQLNDGGNPATDYPDDDSVTEEAHQPSEPSGTGATSEDDPETSPEVPTP